jgi:translation initiation factor 2 subunit 1
MFSKKQNLPESSEIVLCTVKRILHNSVFVDLDEYDNKEGIIHISEIAPGRIRTIREYVKEGKKIVCKVLRINQIHGNIELSLRRVTTSVRMNKMEQISLEQKAEKMLEVIAKMLNTNALELYKKISPMIIQEYGLLNACFEDVVKEGEQVLTKLGIEKQIASKLAELIKQRIKPPEVHVSKTLIVKNPSPDGIITIKSAFKKTIELAKSRNYELKTGYLGSAQYRFQIKSTDYKKANIEIEEVIKTLTTEIQKTGGIVEVAKEK